MVAQKPEKKRTRDRSIVYIGNDHGYWADIKKRYNALYADQLLRFRTLTGRGAGEIQKIFVQVVRIRPRIVYIDLSICMEDYVGLAQLLTREPCLQKGAIVGLVEHKEAISVLLPLGLSFIHIKCGEFHDVVYNPMYLACPEEVIDPNFATAQLEKAVSLNADFRLGYVTPESVHCEGNFKLEKGQTIELDNELPKESVPSKKFLVKEVFDHNLYYNYRYAYDLQLKFIDEPQPAGPDKAEEKKEDPPEEPKVDDGRGEKLAQKKAELDKEKKERETRLLAARYEDDLRLAKKAHNAWVLDNSDLSAPKKTKILLVDAGVNILGHDGIKPLDEYPYCFRVCSGFSKDMEKIKRYRPDLIAVQFFGQLAHIEDDKGDDDAELFLRIFAELAKKNFVLEPKKSKEGKKGEEEEEAVVYNPLQTRRDEMAEEVIALKDGEVEMLKSLTKKIAEVGDYAPFVIVFNCTFATSEQLRKICDYTNIFVNKASMGIESLLDLAGALEKRNVQRREETLKKKLAQLRASDPQKFGRMTVDGLKQKRYYVKKSNPLSHACYTFPITLLRISEASCVFSCERQLEEGNYRMEEPVEMSLRIVPEKGKNELGGETYFALVHSIDENMKKKLRHYVNQIFFTPLNEQREEELERWMKKNQEALEERERTAREKKEAREKAAAEAAKLAAGEEAAKSRAEEISEEMRQENNGEES